MTPVEDMRGDVAEPVAFSPDGEWLATRCKSHENVFHIWDTSTGNRILENESHGKVKNLVASWRRDEEAH